MYYTFSPTASNGGKALHPARQTRTTRSVLTHLIIPFLFLSSSTWVKKCCSGAFVPRSSVITQHRYGPLISQHNSDGMAADETKSSNRRLVKRRKSLLRQKLREHFERLTSDEARGRATPLNDHKYEKYFVGEKFMDSDFYWQDKVRTERLRAMFQDGCLYHPNVVNDLYSGSGCAEL